MRMLLGLVLTAVTVMVMPSGARADDADVLRICLADKSTPAQKAATCTNVIMNMPPSDPQVLARVYISRGNARLGLHFPPALALPDFDAAIRIDPSNPAGFSARGALLLEQKEIDRAIADFDQAIRLNPKDGSSLTNRGSAYRTKGRFDDALQDFDSAIAIAPNSIDAYFGRALTFQEKGRYDFDAFLNEGLFEDRAIADYSKILQLDPGGAGSYSNRGALYQRERKYDLAIADFTEAVRLRPANPLYLKNRAYTYMLARHFDLAIADYRKALTLQLDATTRGQIEAALKDLGAAP